MATSVAELIFIPAPGLGHIMSTIEIAKLLVNRDHHLSITVLVMKSPNSGSDSATTTYIGSLATNTTNRITFIELPQDETPPMHDPKAPVTSYDEFIKSHCKYTLHDDQNQDVIELSNSDTEILVPSYDKPIPTKVFPAIVQTKESLDFILRLTRKLKEVKAIMVNTFLELERHAIESLSNNTIPPVYPVGPIINLEGGIRKPFDDDIIRWLDSQPPSSVVLLCFGSMGSFDEVQVKEIACGLEKSGHRFVWSLRGLPSSQTSNVPREYEDPRVVLPEGFLERTSGLGKVIGWAPQVAMLSHKAIGGFVTHCGWNSLLESLWFGVPSATWPLYAEQQVNAFEMVVELGLAVEIKLDYKMDLFNPQATRVVVTTEEIERGIRQVMGDNEIRTKVKEMSAKSRYVVVEGGSSYESVGRFIQEFIGKIS